jgi:hypothetical protein
MVRIDLPLAMVEGRIKGLLEQGDGFLSQELTRQWAHIVSVWTSAPASTNVSELVDIEASLKQPLRYNPNIRQFIVQYLLRGENHCALFEDAVAREGDLALVGTKVPYAVCEGFVFPFICNEHASDEDVVNLLAEAWSWRLVGVLTATKHLRHKETLQRSDFSRFVANAEHIIVGAWDGEGIIVIDRDIAATYEW